MTSSDAIDFILVLGNVNDVGVATSVVDSAITKGKLDLISTSGSPGLTVKGDGSSENGTIQLNCSQNSHGVKISSPDHSSGQSYELILPTGNVTADKFLKVASVSGSGTTGIGQLSFADAATAYYNQLANVSISDGDSYADAQNVFSSTYRNYLILLENIQVSTNSADLQLLYLKSDSSSPSEHTYAAHNSWNSDYDNNWGGVNSSNVTLMVGQGSGAGKYVSGFFNAFNPNSTTDGVNRFTWHVSSRKHDGNNGYVIGGGNVATNSARTGIRIKANSGNLSGGRVVVYGITNPS